MASGVDSREKKTADMAYTTEKFFADIDAKNYINEFRRTDYFIEFCQQCKNYSRRYGCPPFDDKTLSIVEGYEKVRIMGVKIIPNNKQLPLSAANDLMKPVITEMNEELLELEKSLGGYAFGFVGLVRIAVVRPAPGSQVSHADTRIKSVRLWRHLVST
jgi:predicted metal-binding protein